MTSQTDSQILNASSFPTYIVLDKWEDAGFTWEGEITPTVFSRLLELIEASHRQVPIKLRCELTKKDNINWLHMSFDGVLWVECQRCLQPLDIELDYETKLALLYDESQSNHLDEEIDFVLLDEVVESKQQQRLLPLGDLVEDELLLNVPLSAKHDDCEMAVDQVGEIEEEEEQSPFAALAALKDQLSD